MKKFLNAILLLALLPISMIAESYNVAPTTTTTGKNTGVKISYLATENIPASLKPIDNTLGATYTPFKGSTGMAIRTNWVLQSGTEPFVYEPISGSYLLVGRGMARDAVDSLDATKNWGTTFILSSSNNGLDWAYNEIYRSQNNINVLPTLAVANTTSTNNPLDFNYFVFSRLAKFETGKTNATWIGAQLLFYSEDYTGHIESNGPIDNNPNQRQEWYTTRSVSYKKGAEFRAMNADRLSAKEGTQFGAYGALYANLSSVDFNSEIPAAWGFDKFAAATDIKSTQNNDLYMDTDPEGNVYVALNNLFADIPEKRRLGVSVSTNNGENWVDFVKMPMSIVSDFATSVGTFADSIIFIPYQQDAFVVYGVEKFSYFCMVQFHPQDDIVYDRYLTEINYDNGNWSMRSVSKLQLQSHNYVGNNLMNGTMYSINLQELNPMSTTEDPEFPFLGSNSFEIDAAVSEDGYVIVKWLDHRKDTVFFPTTTLYSRVYSATEENAYRAFTWDTMPSNDVFVANRTLSATSWAPQNKYNVTDDILYNKNTFMPKRVKTAKKVPIAFLTPNEAILKANYSEYAELPSFLVGLVADINASFDLKYLIADATAVSVNDVVASNNSFEIFPNPVAGITNFNYTIENEGNVAIRISNSLGQPVAVVTNGDLSAGNYNASFDASSLSNGTYFVTMTVNGNSVTKVMNIVR